MSIHWFIKNSKYQQFLFWKKNRKKNHRFFMFSKGHYFIMGGPIDMNVDVFWEIPVGFPKNAVLQLFPKYSKSYVNLNVKSTAKFNCCFSVFCFDITCRTLQKLFRRVLVIFVTFVVLEILDNLNAKLFKCK